MPSLVIDEAAAAAQEEIAAAISSINNNLNNINTSKTHHSSPHYHDYSSPLFRDEVIQQEMRYFDQVLHGADNGLGGISSGRSGRNITTSSRKENNVVQQQQRQHHNPEQRKRSPYHTSRYQSKHHVRSRNRRNQENHELIKKAKHSSRKVMRKLAGLGKRCTKQWGLVANTIHYKITMAVANMHSLLTEDIGQHSRRSTDDGNATTKTSNDNKQPCTNKKSDKQSSRASLAVPNVCFTDTSLWLKKRTQTISSKAITKAKSAILQVATAKNHSRKIPHIV